MGYSVTFNGVFGADLFFSIRTDRRTGVTKKTSVPGDGKTLPKEHQELTLHYTGWVKTVKGKGWRDNMFCKGPLKGCDYERKDDTEDTCPKCQGTRWMHSKFDCTRKKGKPFKYEFGRGRMVRGWEEGVAQMSLGERAELDMTYDFAYNERGPGGVIPPKADLIFDIQLLAIGDKKCEDYQTLYYTRG